MEKKYFIEMDKKDPLKEFRNHFFCLKILFISMGIHSGWHQR